MLWYKRGMENKDSVKIFTVRLPIELYEWLKGRVGGMNVTIIEALKKIKTEEEAEDAYNKGFNDGYTKARKELKQDK